MKDGNYKDLIAHQAPATSFTLLSTMMGASLLSVAYLLHKLGLVLGIILFALTVAQVLFFMKFFIEAAHYTGSKTYRELTEKALSRTFSLILDFSLYISYFGYLTGYIAVTSRNVKMFFNDVIVQVNHTYEIVIKVVIAYVLIFPLTLLKSLKSLGKVSSVSVFIIFLAGASFIGYFFYALSKGRMMCGNKMQLHAFPSTSTYSVLYQVLNFFMYIPGLQGYFTTHTIVPNLIQELYGPPVIRKKIVAVSLTMALLFAFTVYMLVGIMNSAMFDDKTLDNIFLSYQGCGQIYMDVISLLYALCIIIAYPLALYPIKVSFMDLIKVPLHRRTLASFLISFVVVSATLALACVLENIVYIFGLFGSLAGFFFYFFIPLMIINKLPQIKAQNLDKDIIHSQEDYTIDSISVAMLALAGPTLDVRRARTLSNKIFGIQEAGAEGVASLTNVPVTSSRRMSIVATDDTVKIRSRLNSMRSSGSFSRHNNEERIEIRANENYNFIEQMIQENSDTVEEVEQVKIEYNLVIKSYKWQCYTAIVIYAVVCVEGVVMNLIDIIKTF